MDCVKIGRLIAALRKEKGLTQKNVADALGILSKTVSKWECGLGCPDLSYWPELSMLFGVDMAQMMEGKITFNQPDHGNMEKIRFSVCPSCGNIVTSTSGASVFCCGRKLDPLVPANQQDAPEIEVKEMDADDYIQFQHPMTKEHFIYFAAYVKTDLVILQRLYPEQSPAARFPIMKGGTLYLCCTRHGLAAYPR